VYNDKYSPYIQDNNRNSAHYDEVKLHGTRDYSKKEKKKNFMKTQIDKKMELGRNNGLK